MARVDGAYDCMTKTPLGDQASVFTIVSDGDRFHGTNANALGSLDVTDGKVEGDRLTWRMDMTLPMPVTMQCEGIVDGDTITASIDGGRFRQAYHDGQAAGVGGRKLVFVEDLVMLTFVGMMDGTSVSWPCDVVPPRRRGPRPRINPRGSAVGALRRAWTPACAGEQNWRSKALITPRPVPAHARAVSVASAPLPPAAGCRC